MLNIGIGEIVLLLVVALVVIGPRQLPETARTLAKIIRQGRKVVQDLQKTLLAEDDPYGRK